MSDKGTSKQPFPPLQIKCKNRFPFAIACPSFVHRAGYRDNVRALGDGVDEIQLLFFESRPDAIPSAPLIRALADLAAQTKIGYQVHLPTDVHPGHPDPDERRRAANAWAAVIDRCVPLSPSTYTLHLSRNPLDCPSISHDQWLANLQDTIQGMLPPGFAPVRLTAETLDYPFDRIAPLIAATDLSVCMDIGHLMVHGEDIAAFYARWQSRITTIHLHGVDGARDHLPLDRLPAHRMESILDILNSFTGTVTVEVYSHAALVASLATLVACWDERARRMATGSS